MASEITEHHHKVKATVEGRDRILEKLSIRGDADAPSTVVLVGDPGIGKTWLAKEISRHAINQDLCYASLWISLTDDYKRKPKPTPKTVTLHKAKSMPEGSKTETILEESKTETIPEEFETETIQRAKSLPDPEIKTIFEETQTQTMPKESQTQIQTIPEESKAEIETETMPEESKTETTGEESETEKYKTEIRRLLVEAIARQILSQSSSSDEWEAANNVKEEKKQTIEEMVNTKLKQKKDASSGNKNILLVLDESLVLGQSKDQTNINELLRIVFEKFKDVLTCIEGDPLLTLFTRRKVEETETSTQLSETEIVFEVEPLSWEESSSESLNLLESCVQKVVSDPQCHQEHLKKIARKSKGLPAAISMIAEAIARHGSRGLTLESALEKAADYKIATECVNPLIHCAYEMLPTEVLKFCFGHSIQFFSKYSGIHYIELITQWILEGYFDSFDLIKKKYQEGHAVLMDLINRRMLKIQEANIIVAEGAAMDMIDCLPGFLGKSRLGLAGVSENGQRIDLGRITQIDGMIKTICDPKKWQEVSTLLIDGDRLRLEVDEELFVPMKKLEALAIFNSGLTSLVLSASESEKQPPALPAPEPENQSKPEDESPGSENSEPEGMPMKLLVLRSCDLLNGITHIEQLKTLTVLEISGACSLKKIPDRLLDDMIQLQSLNLSGCQMEYLLSLSKLIELRFLILRDCSSLKKLPRINKLKYLEIIDLSGATSLTYFPEQDLSRHPNLQMIDLSRTPIKRLPKFGHLKKLARITIGGCKKVRIFPSLQNLGGLKILYLSGIEFRNFHKIKPRDPNTESLRLIPDTISELYVRDCPTLKCLPPITGLQNLEVLDVSGASDSEFAISDESFRDLVYLRELNFSNTKLKELPSLSNLRSLRKLLLKNCKSLTKLPEMNGLGKLELLDLSGCSNLVGSLNLKDFPKLEILDISNTRIIVDTSETNVKVIRDERHRQAYGVFNLAESQADEKNPSILVNDGEMLQSLQENPELQDECMKQISMPVCPPNEQATDAGNRNSNDDVMFRNFYLQAKGFHPYNEGAKFLEIRRLKSFCAGLKDALNNTEYISWVDLHESLKSLSDLDAGSLKKMKGCWIERCFELVSIFTDPELFQKLEILWVSNLPEVVTFFNLQSVSLGNLKHLHLDCCPKLKYVFSSSQIPENLEVLEIKFCDNLETLYKKIEGGPDECTLSKLHTLLLFELPELKKIGIDIKMSNPLIWECPKLEPPPTSPIEAKDGHLKFSCRPSTEEINVVT